MNKRVARTGSQIKTGVISFPRLNHLSAERCKNVQTVIQGCWKSIQGLKRALYPTIFWTANLFTGLENAKTGMCTGVSCSRRPPERASADSAEAVTPVMVIGVSSVRGRPQCSRIFLKRSSVFANSQWSRHESSDDPHFLLLLSPSLSLLNPIKFPPQTLCPSLLLHFLLLQPHSPHQTPTNPSRRLSPSFSPFPRPAIPNSLYISLYHLTSPYFLELSPLALSLLPLHTSYTSLPFTHPDTLSPLPVLSEPSVSLISLALSLSAFHSLSPQYCAFRISITRPWVKVCPHSLCLCASCPTATRPPDSCTQCDW
ncbi:uncharacterized protein LOC132389814 isoform X2 [Hypanus sabinus]|uniref:uncharacterized protein LOC132389814 isoform X2 n=1 Tax=Hypanus sabinus TaxID=79690 RepID=UPI0028C42627|nr:uncharacterized protein LOC132389814 isoform X2 [Hypanus sabinus]